MMNGPLIELYIENINALRAYAYSMVRNADDADDVVQEIAVRIIRVSDEGRPVQNPKSYLFGCARNLALDCIRRRRESPEPDDVLAAHAAYAPNDIAETDTRLSLDQYLRDLPPETKQAFIRHYFEFEPISSIAKDLNIEPASLRARFYRIRKSIPKSVFLTVMLIRILHLFA